jgi:hypothetical protein
MISLLKTTAFSFLIIGLFGCNLTCKKNAGQALAGSSSAITVTTNASQVVVYHRSLVLGELISGYAMNNCSYTEDEAMQELGRLQAELETAVDEVVAAQSAPSVTNVGESWASSCVAECSCGFYNLVMQKLPPGKANPVAKEQLKTLSDNFSTEQRRVCATRLERYCQ